MSESYFVLREDCPACGSANKKELYYTRFTEPPIRTYLVDFYSPQGGVEFDYLKDAHFILDECTECGLVYQRLIPNDFLMNKLYEEWIDPAQVFDSKDKSRAVGYYVELARQIETIIRFFSVPPNELKLLDFGMGWGEWCRMAIAYGCTAFGTELSQSRVEHAKKFGVSVITWEDISKHQLDFINTEQVFEHISNPLDTLYYLSKSLKPNGIIRISVPDGWDIKKRLAIMDWSAPKGSKNSLNPIAPLEHVNCFSENSLVRMAQICGLDQLKMPLQITKKKKLKDLTLRDIIRPLYHRQLKVKYGQKNGSTNLFFQKRKA